MNTKEFLEKIYQQYSNSYDLFRPYRINDREYPAYGYFFSRTEKYVLVREANMWSANSYEHVIFLEAQECTPGMIEEVDDIFRNYFEPCLVRKGEKLPEKEHMYSYLSAVLVVQRPVAPDCVKRIKKYKFEKGYQFNFRGYSQGRIVCCSMDDQKFYSNYHARSQKEFFKKLFTEE